MAKTTLKQQLQNRYDHVKTIKLENHNQTLQLTAGNTYTYRRNLHTGSTTQITIQALIQNQDGELLLAGNHTQ